MSESRETCRAVHGWSERPGKKTERSQHNDMHRSPNRKRCRHQVPPAHKPWLHGCIIYSLAGGGLRDSQRPHLQSTDVSSRFSIGCAQSADRRSGASQSSTVRLLDGLTRQLVDLDSIILNTKEDSPHGLLPNGYLHASASPTSQIRPTTTVGLHASRNQTEPSPAVRVRSEWPDRRKVRRHATFARDAGPARPPTTTAQLRDVESWDADREQDTSRPD